MFRLRKKNTHNFFPIVFDIAKVTHTHYLFEEEKTLLNANKNDHDFFLKKKKTKIPVEKKRIRY